MSKNIETLLLQYRSEDIRSNYSGILHLALQIVKSHIRVDPSEKNKKLLDKLQFIKENTSKKLRTPYFLIVHVVARNMYKPLHFPIEVKTGRRRVKEFELGELIQELEEAHIRINDIYHEVAQNYSIDIPISNQGKAMVFDFSNPQQGMNERFKYNKG